MGNVFRSTNQNKSRLLGRKLKNRLIMSPLFSEDKLPCGPPRVSLWASEIAHLEKPLNSRVAPIPQPESTVQHVELAADS